MNWNLVYRGKLEELNNHRLFPSATIKDVVHLRTRRFKENYPTKPEHFSELEFLILNHDHSGELFKIFQTYITEDIKSELIIKKSDRNSKFYIDNIIQILTPYYLSNPERKNSIIDAEIIEEQIIKILNGIDHKNKRKRTQANKLLENITPNFNSLSADTKSKTIELLNNKLNVDNIQKVNNLILKNIKSIEQKRIQACIDNQVLLNLMSPKMAILYIKKVKNLNEINKN